MEFVVVGKELLDYTSKKTGKQVKGYSLHLTYEKDNCDGVAVCTEFVSEDMGEDVEINDKVELVYNKYGKVHKILAI